MEIKLSDHFGFKKLIRFVYPSIIMMVFTSVYGVVDGFFVSNYAGKTPFAAVNLIMPFIMIIGTVGFLVGSGGSALVSKTLGEGKGKKANEIFSLLVYFTIITGVVFTVLAQLFLKRVSIALGADEAMLEHCVLYGRITLCSMPFFMLQSAFQSFLVTAERPKLGLAVTVIAGVNNMVLDFLLVGVFKLGITGASVATVISEVLGGGIPLLYFIFNKSTAIRLGKTHFDIGAIAKTCTNGASELMTNISMSLMNMIYNFRLIKIYGENGIAAYGVLMYVSFIFVAVFIGYSIGVAPIVGYSYGAKNHSELKNLLKKSVLFNMLSGLLMLSSALLLAKPFAQFFTGYDRELFELTKTAFMLFSTHFLIAGHNIFGSAFFTALNNGAVSAAISFSRTLLFQFAAVMLMPMLFGIESIWLAITAAELLTLVETIFFILKNKNKYHYI